MKGLYVLEKLPGMSKKRSEGDSCLCITFAKMLGSRNSHDNASCKWSCLHGC